MAELEELDEATLEAKLKTAESYEDRAAIRKALREAKRRKGIEVGGAKKRGSSQYNRFVCRPPDAKSVSQSFVPSHNSPSPLTSTPPLRTPTPPVKEQEKLRELEREREELAKREKENEEKEREREEREKKEREIEERESEEREKREREREEREKREREREEKEREEREQREREREERKREREEREQREREREEREREEEKEREVEETEEGEGDEILETEPEDPSAPEREDWVLVDKEAAQELESEVTAGESTDGPPVTIPSQKEESEFQKFKLRKANEGGDRSKSSAVNTHDFGVKLKKPRPPGEESPTPPKSSKTTATPTTRGGGAPRTLADYQQLATRGKSSVQPATTTTTTQVTSKDKHALIRVYVNAALVVRPPISSDHALYQLCSKPSNLCKLINKSVRGTVDLRALTKTPPPSASSADLLEAIEENMLLVVESARAIGCSVSENMPDELVSGDHNAIDKLLLELIRARVVHMPNMDDEPSLTFNNLSAMMSKLGLTAHDDVDEGIEREEEVPITWREKDSKKLQEHIARDEIEEHSLQSETSSWRDERNKKTPEIDLDKPSFDANLSYEERAALRRAERERKKKEREGYATPK